MQARPETIQARRDLLTFEEYSMQGGGKPLVTGVSGILGAKSGRGARARTFWMPSRSASSSPAKEVLVTDITDPDWEPIMKVASAIVTIPAAALHRAAARSGIPAVVGCGNATKKLKTGQLVTVSCAESGPGIRRHAEIHGA